MNANQDTLYRLVEDVFVTRDDEIQCEEARILIARCAQTCLTAEESRRQYPMLWHHFRFCPDCAEEYGLAMELARLERDGQLQQPTRLPPRPDRGRADLWARAADAVVAVFPGFPSLAGAGAPVRGADLATEPVEVILSESSLRILFDIAVNEQDATLRDLFCTISPAGEAPPAALEGAPVWLLVGDDGPPVSEEAVDELGDVAFSRLAPGLYALRLDLAGQVHIVTDIVLP